MAGDIIWYLTVLGCALLFVGIGVYAGKLEKPMWFWSGSHVDPAAISDVKAYNRENARMWYGYSLWFWVSGLSWAWSKLLALAAMVLGCTVGIAILVGTYLRIEKKYTIKP